MMSVKVVHTAGEDWAHAAKVCADGLLEADPTPGYTLGFLYVTDLLAEDMGSILTYLRQKTGIAQWVGSVGIGICANRGESADNIIPDDQNAAEYFNRPAVAVMAMALPEEQFRILPTLKNGINEVPADVADWIDGVQSQFGIIHGDPGNARLTGLIDDLSGQMSGFLVGGVTSSTSATYQVAERVTGGGISGVVFAPDVEVATCVSQGCSPISDNHIISDCVDNVLIGLDGDRAMDVFTSDIGAELSSDLTQIAGLIHAALPIEGSDTGDYLVRSLVGVDPERGWLAISEEVSTGDRVMFVRRDQESAEMDLRDQLHHLKRRLKAPPSGGLYFSCLGRGPSLFQEEAHEISIITELLGDIPLVGFYGNGEISNSRLYGYTGVLVLFP